MHLMDGRKVDILVRIIFPGVEGKTALAFQDTQEQVEHTPSSTHPESNSPDVAASDPVDVSAAVEGEDRVRILTYKVEAWKPTM